MQLPIWVAAKLGIDPEVTPERVEEFEGLGYVQAVPGLSWSSLAHAVNQPARARVEFVRTLGVNAWRYGRIVSNGQVECDLVEIPPAIESTSELPPTDAERTLAEAWLIDEAVDPEFLQANFANYVLLVWRTTEQDATLTADAALVIAGIPGYRNLLPVAGSCRDKAYLSIEAASEIQRDRSFLVSLVGEALAQRKPGLRFLYFYRVFERAYLRAALKKFEAQFLSEPKAAVNDVVEVMKSERNRLIALIGTDQEIKDWFVVFEDECIRLEKAQNRLVTALTKSCRDDGWLTGDAWQRGCSLFYKLRCSIAHSGTSGPVYEAFGDSDVACERLVPIVEQAALKYLGIRSEYFLP